MNRPSIIILDDLDILVPNDEEQEVQLNYLFIIEINIGFKKYSISFVFN